MLKSSKAGNHYTIHVRSVQCYYANFTNREVKNQELVSGRISYLPKNTESQWQNSEYSQNAQSVSGCHQTTQPFFSEKKSKQFLLQAYNSFSHLYPINLNKRNLFVAQFNTYKIIQ